MYFETEGVYAKIHISGSFYKWSLL